MTLDLFPPPPERAPWTEQLAPGAVVLHRFAVNEETTLLGDLAELVSLAPLRQMTTPGGYLMSVQMTNCGPLGWVTDRTGYRYAGIDPQTGKKWPQMPDTFRLLAHRAALEAGFDGFEPDACLINRYAAGTRLTLHQDRNERDFDAPIVSVSLGLPAVFLFGGDERGDKTTRVPLVHGDVAVWGGASRLRYHGVLPLKPGDHPLTGACRMNLTFRKAG